MLCEADSDDREAQSPPYELDAALYEQDAVPNEAQSANRAVLLSGEEPKAAHPELRDGPHAPRVIPSEVEGRHRMRGMRLRSLDCARDDTGFYRWRSTPNATHARAREPPSSQAKCLSSRAKSRDPTRNPISSLRSGRRCRKGA
jgi:hypothetical protein